MDLRRDSFANEQTFSQGLCKSCAKSEALCQKPTHHHNRTIAADPDVDRTYLVAGIPADRDPALVYLATLENGVATIRTPRAGALEWLTARLAKKSQAAPHHHHFPLH